jgi:hypothetical protein
MGGGGASSEVKETPAQAEAKQVAVEQWNWHVTKGKPFEDAFIQRAALPTADKEAVAARTTGADIAQAQGSAMAQPGFDPNKGSALQVGTKAAKVAGSAIPAAQQSIDDYRTSLVRGYTEMLRGEVPHINASYLNQAQNAASQAQNAAEINQAQTASRNNTIGSGIGAVMGAGAAAYNTPSSTNPSFLNSKQPAAALDFSLPTPAAYQSGTPAIFLR